MPENFQGVVYGLVVARQHDDDFWLHQDPRYGTKFARPGWVMARSQPGSASCHRRAGDDKMPASGADSSRLWHMVKGGGGGGGIPPPPAAWSLSLIQPHIPIACKDSWRELQSPHVVPYRSARREVVQRDNP